MQSQLLDLLLRNVNYNLPNVMIPLYLKQGDPQSLVLPNLTVLTIDKSATVQDTDLPETQHIINKYINLLSS